MKWDRRQFIAAGGAAVSALSLQRPGWAASPPADARPPAGARPAHAVPPAPVARVEVVRDTYFSETLSDPYRWMENDQDADWLPFLKAQNDHARAILDALPTRAGLLERIAELSGETVATSRVQRAGGSTFVTQRHRISARPSS